MKSSTICRLFLFGILAVAANLSIEGHAKAFDSYYGNPFFGGYNYGYANRLPAPPYFSIYPPVYYGRRYERPYGDSPFAMESQLSSTPSYQIRPKQTPTPWSTNVWTTGSASLPNMQSERMIPSTQRADLVSPSGKKITVLNPFVRNNTAVAGK